METQKEHPLRTARKRHHLTLAELGKAASLTAGTVSRIELRIRKGNIDTYRRIGRALGVDWRTLVED